MVTRSDIFIKILSETTDKTEKEVQALLDAFKAAHPGEHKFDEKLPVHEAEKLMDELRAERSGILAWLEHGARRVEKRTGHA